MAGHRGGGGEKVLLFRCALRHRNVRLCRGRTYRPPLEGGRKFGGRIVRDNWKKEGKRQPGELILKYQFATPEAKGVLEFIPEAPVPAPEAKPTHAASSVVPPGPGVYTYSAPGMPMCPECDQRPAIFYCSTHQSAVCLECVSRHDEPGRVRLCPRISRTEAARRASDNLAIGQAAERRQAPRHSWHRIGACPTIRDWQGQKVGAVQRPASNSSFS